MSVTPPIREQFLVISAMGPNPMELTNVLFRSCMDNRCAVVSSRLSRHGEYSALILQVSGNWDGLARLEGGLAGLGKRHGFTVGVTRSAALENRPQALPYVVYVSAAYRPDILNELCQFFADHKIEVEKPWCAIPTRRRRPAAPCSTPPSPSPCRPAPRSVGCVISSWISPTP
ncbi:glycine cleavage system transcriptional repressor [Pseudomonas psychrotolerans]|nr:glycine cleavage system transcriptional repressor [Pseudomonas psychrotolerans]